MPLQPLSCYSLPSCIPLHGEALRLERTAEREVDWIGLPMIATIVRLLCRELTLQSEYLRLENRMPQCPGTRPCPRVSLSTARDAALRPLGEPHPPPLDCALW